MHMSQDFPPASWTTPPALKLTLNKGQFPSILLQRIFFPPRADWNSV